jgi:hypothetical protein
MNRRLLVKEATEEDIKGWFVAVVENNPCTKPWCMTQNGGLCFWIL